MKLQQTVRIAALLALGTLASSAQALTWTSSTGDALNQGGTLTLTTAYLDGAEDQPSNVSGHSASDIALVEALAGVPAYALNLSPSQYGTEGSAAGLQLNA